MIYSYDRPLHNHDKLSFQQLFYNVGKCLSHYILKVELKTEIWYYISINPFVSSMLPSRICVMLETVFPIPEFLKNLLMFSFNTYYFNFLH